MAHVGFEVNGVVKPMHPIVVVVEREVRIHR
jgi:hypothetical protein